MEADTPMEPYRGPYFAGDAEEACDPERLDTDAEWAKWCGRPTEWYVEPRGVPAAPDEERVFLCEEHRKTAREAGLIP